MNFYEPPAVDTRVVCIVDKERVDLAAVISSYFSGDGVYFPLFTFLGVKHSDRGQDNFDDDEFVSRMIGTESAIKLSNAMAMLGDCEYLILAGLSEAQRSYLRLPERATIIEINTLAEVREQLRTIGIARIEKLRCKRSQVLLGLYVAKNREQCLEIADEADELAEPAYHPGGIVLIEATLDNAACVIAANYAYSVNANIKIVPPISRNDGRRILRLLQDWRDGNDKAAREALFEEIGKRIGDVPFSRFEYATFFTDGVPYSLGLGGMIPCSYAHLSLSVDHFILDNILAERNRQLASAVLFAIDELASSGETQWLSDFLSHRHYFIRYLRGTRATSHSFGYHAEHFPYGILHIASHGGEVDGYSVTEKFVDRNGGEHVLEYDEVVGFSRAPGDELIAVQRKVIFKSIDGLDWSSDERTPERIPHYVYEDMRKKVFAKGTWGEGTERERKSSVPWSSCIKCNDSIHQAMFRTVAAYGAPLVFNNTCWSWAAIADFFISGGARAYVGTLWAVHDEVAVAAAKTFYERAIGANIVRGVHRMREAIRDREDADIYVAWALHFSTLSEGESSERSASAVCHRLARSLSMYIHQLDEVTSDEVRDNAIEIVELLDQEFDSLCAGPHVDRLRADVRAALIKAGPKKRSGNQQMRISSASSSIGTTQSRTECAG